MRRVPATTAVRTFAGWHPLGLFGIAAALTGLLMFSHTLAGRKSDPADPKNITAAAANDRLASQHAGLSERLLRFPPVEQHATQIAALDAIAHEHGVVIGGGEYRDTDSPMPSELAVLELRLPLQGPPLAVRAFLSGLQREMPWLAIDQFMLERDGSVLRGEVRGRMFLREGT